MKIQVTSPMKDGQTAEQTKTNGWTNEQTGIDKIEANASTISKKYMDKCVH